MDNLFDTCLESVMLDSYCTEGFKDTLKRAGKAVGKGIVATIDFFINTVRRMINAFANVYRKIRGKETKSIENRTIVRDFLSDSARIIAIRNKIVKIIDPYSEKMREHEKEADVAIKKTLKAVEEVNKAKARLKDIDSKELVTELDNMTYDIIRKEPEQAELFINIAKQEKRIYDTIGDMKDMAEDGQKSLKRHREFLANSKKRTGNNDMHVRDLYDDKDGKKFDEYMRNNNGKLIFD